MVVIAIHSQYFRLRGQIKRGSLPVEVMHLGMFHSLHLIIRHDCGGVFMPQRDDLETTVAGEVLLGVVYKDVGFGRGAKSWA